MFGCKLSPGKKQDVAVADGELFILKNAMLTGASIGENYTLFIHPEGAESLFAVCHLSASAPHTTLSIPFNGTVAFTLKPENSSAVEKLNTSKAVAHLVGQRAVEINGLARNVANEKQSSSERELKRQRVQEGAAAEKTADDRGKGDVDTGDDIEEGGEDTTVVASETAASQRKSAGGDAGDSEDEEEESFAEPVTEEEYKQALVMYLRQHGITTLVKLGQAVKKPKCVKKSLGKFLNTVKASQGKRNGFTLEVDGDKVHLVMKTNYSNAGQESKKK